jgi:hypothetical protein
MQQGRSAAALTAILLSLLLVSGVAVVAQSGPDRCLVPASVRQSTLNEYSGEQALLHVQMLSANRGRTAEEYKDGYMESSYLREMANKYGLSDVKVDFFPSGEVWDAEEGDLWLIEPVKKKLASLTMVRAALASGSTGGDVESEVVYVGANREPDYAGKDVTGKIVLGNASVSNVFNIAVTQRGAAGALGTGSAGVNSDSAGYNLDQIGWQSVSSRPDRPGFGWVLSLRQFNELRNYLESGRKVVMRSHIRTRSYPGKMNVISAAIPGTDANAGELIYVSHAFERVGTPGANDNCTGVATILEIGRTLARLIKNGDLPVPKRTIRFLWVPEISGSTEFMYKYPELQDKLIVGLNFDMTGANLETTDSYLRMKMTPDSRPSFLNDLIANLLQFVDQTEIRTQQGNNAPFNYRLVPFIAASDHTVFLNGGIPTMQFNHWPDNFYHSSEDRIIHVDPTELKRIGFVAASAFYYLATAGAQQARNLAWESAARGDVWLAEVARQSARLLRNDPAAIHDGYKAAQNKVAWAFQRARGGVESVLKLSAENDVASLVKTLVATLDGSREVQARRLEALYSESCRRMSVKPQAITLTAKEKEYAQLVPRRLFKVYSQEYRTRNQASRSGRGSGAPANEPRLPGLAASEVANFIDGTRSILDIYNAVRAEYGNVTTNNNEWKFAYVVTPDTADIDMETVAAAIRAMEKAGLVEIVTAAPKAK